MKNKTLIVIIFVIAVLGIGVFYIVNRGGKKETSAMANRNRELSIKGFVVDSLTMWETLTRNGLLVAEEETDLAFETSGKIIELNIKEGQKVKKGELLARLNDEVLQAQLATYEAKMPLAEKKLERQKILVKEDAASVESLEVLETELNSLKASIQLVKAQIKQTYLRAPFDGIIGLRNISLGSFVSTSSPIIKITKNSPLKIEFTIPSKYLSAIQNVNEISFVTGNNKTPNTAKIYAMNAKMDESNTLTIRALFANEDGQFMPGEFASVQIELNKQPGSFAVPNQAMTATTEGSTVFLCKNKKIEIRNVQIGIRTDSLLQITEGLQMGDTIAITGLLQLKEGMTVNVNIEK